MFAVFLSYRTFTAGDSSTIKVKCDIFMRMELNRVAIKNYRSIQELELNFDPKCRILVGINESGKTNILRALSLLDPKELTTRRDVREPRLNEAQVNDAYVRFIFKFNDEEIAMMIESLKAKILSTTYQSPIIKIGGVDHD